MGCLAMTSELMYAQWGATTANVLVGVLSAVVDSIPVKFAVLTMNPDMSLGQWLLVTINARTRSRPIDVFDLFLHATPAVLVILKLGRRQVAGG